MVLGLLNLNMVVILNQYFFLVSLFFILFLFTFITIFQVTAFAAVVIYKNSPRMENLLKVGVELEVKRVGLKNRTEWLLIRKIIYV